MKDTAKPREFTPKQMALIDKFRDINVDHCAWYDCTEELLSDTFKLLGLSPSSGIYFDIYHRHIGMELSSFRMTDILNAFDGYENLTEGDHMFWLKESECDLAVAVRSIFDVVNTRCAMARLSQKVTDYIEDYDVNVLLSRQTSDYRQLDSDGFYNRCDDGDEEMHEALEASLDEAVKELSPLFGDIYRYALNSLAEEYDWATSDEAVWETLEANEMDKDLDDGEDEYVEG